MAERHHRGKRYVEVGALRLNTVSEATIREYMNGDDA